MNDVIIAGAGPVGLFLACELGLRGASVLVLEREPDAPSPWRTAPMGMRGLNAASVEAFARRGLQEAILTASGAGSVPDDDGAAVRPRSAGHFAGIMLDAARVRDEALVHRLPSPATEWVMTTLHAVGSVLRRRAVELGVRVRHDAGITAVAQDDDGVVVTAGGQEYRARWLVGCDGGRSTVRRLAGFDFVGTDPQFTGYVFHADVDGLGTLRPGFHLTPRGMYVRMPTDGHFGLMDFDDGAFDRSHPPTREHLEEVLRRISGADVRLRAVHLASSFTDRAMQAPTYRRGRVLLAGDAAHIHSPLGGQGLNSGLGDALNLGWKLAATVHGTAPDGLPGTLLDTYDAERHPVAERVLDWSRAQVSLMRPGPQAPALQAVVRDLLATRDGTTYVWQRVSGASIRYDVGDAHPLAGADAPEFRLAGGTRIGDLLAAGHGVLLDVHGALGEVVAPWADRITHAPGTLRDALGTTAVLVRPDGVVAWATDTAPDPAAFERAARRWFGEPRALVGAATPARRAQLLGRDGEVSPRGRR